MADEIMKEMGIVSGSATKKKGGSGKKVVRRLEIEKADNGGYIVHTSYEQPKSRTSGPGDWIEPDRSVFEDQSSMMKFVTSKLEG